MKRILPFLLLPLAWATAIPASAQESITLDEAIGIALENHPRLKAASATIEQNKAQKGEAWEIAPTAASYSWGQINGSSHNDYQLSLTQDFGSLLTPFYKLALTRQQVETSTQYRELVKREITAEVRRAWVEYLYAKDRCSLLEEYAHLSEQLSQIGEARYQQGEITLLERNMTGTTAAEMKNDLFQAQEEFRLAQQRLQWVCYSSQPLLPAAESSLEIWQCNTQTPLVAASYLSYFGSKLKEQDEQVRIAKSSFFPALSFGYVRQNILPLKGLNSWMIGASFPLFFAPQQSRIKQAKCRRLIERYESQTQLTQLENRQAEAASNLRRYQESLHFFTTSALPEADALIQSAEIHLKNHETDIASYIQSINSALSIKSRYLELMYKNNIAVLEFELYQ